MSPGSTSRAAQSRGYSNFLVVEPRFDESVHQEKAVQVATPLERAENALQKRVFDIVFSSAIILFLLSWMVPLLALIIKLDSKGPVFFVQKRHGRNRKLFGCIKLRTMVPNLAQDQLQAREGDRRITTIGRFLRKYNLDELPQFWNVLRGDMSGDMSVVGPRPHMIFQTEYYEQEDPNYGARLAVKPGITGFAQVNGSQGPTPTIWHMKRRVRYDLLYIKNWSIWLDMYLVLKTIYCTMWRSIHK